MQDPPEASRPKRGFGHPLRRGQLHQLNVKGERLAGQLVVEVQRHLLGGQLDHRRDHAVGQLHLWGQERGKGRRLVKTHT